MAPRRRWPAPTAKPSSSTVIYNYRSLRSGFVRWMFSTHPIGHRVLLHLYAHKGARGHGARSARHVRLRSLGWRRGSAAGPEHMGSNRCTTPMTAGRAASHQALVARLAPAAVCSGRLGRLLHVRLNVASPTASHSAPGGRLDVSGSFRPRTPSQPERHCAIPQIFAEAERSATNPDAQLAHGAASNLAWRAPSSRLRFSGRPISFFRRRFGALLGLMRDRAGGATSMPSRA